MTLEERVYSNDYADLIVRSFYLEVYQNAVPDSEGSSFPLNSQFSTFFLERRLLPANQFGDIPYNSVPKLYTPLSTVSLESAGILQVQNQPVLQLTGAGVIIGIVDTGIDYTHPAFQKSDGTTKILDLWDQTDRTGTPPEFFPYGSEYSRMQIDEALRQEEPRSLVPVDDPQGHGTYLAGVAAGSPSEDQSFIGAAPDADLVVVKLKPAKQYLRDFFYVSPNAVAYQENDIMAGIQYLTQKAFLYKKPLVICIGLGSNQGSRTESMPLTFTLRRLGQIQGITPVAAAGDEAGRAHHYLGAASSGGPTNVEILVPPGSAGFTMELWGQAPQLFSVGFRSPIGETVPRIPVSLSMETTSSFILEETKIYVKYDVITTSGRQLIIIRFEKPTEGIWNLQVYGADEAAREFHLWLPITGFADPDITFLSPNPYTTLTSPSTPDTILTTGAYQAATGSLYIHSSRGYTADNDVKPDFVSPGVDVTGPGSLGSYVDKTGTSAAAALAAGASALLIQWGMERTPSRFYTTQELKFYLIRGAQRDPALTYPNREWGYGTLDLYNSFLSLMTN